MIGYAARTHLRRADATAYELAVEAVAAMPDDQRTSHDVCALLADVIGYEPVCGSYGGVDHSWFELPSGNILDVYAPGRFPPVQLIHVIATTLPERSLYQKER